VKIKKKYIKYPIVLSYLKLTFSRFIVCFCKINKITNNQKYVDGKKKPEKRTWLKQIFGETNKLSTILSAVLNWLIVSCYWFWILCSLRTIVSWNYIFISRTRLFLEKSENLWLRNLDFLFSVGSKSKYWKKK
jgi:hypothetical protein